MSTDFVSELRAELVGAAHRLHRRRARRRRIATAAAGVLLVAGATVAITAVGSEPASAGVEIEVVDGRLILTVTDIEVRTEEVEEALADHGIDADVSSVPVGPSNVGRFARVASELPSDAFLIDENGRTFLGFSIPVDYHGPLELALGRPAAEGEQYVLGSDAFAAGEPLSCADLLGETVADLADFAAEHPELHIDVEVFVDLTPSTQLPVADVAAGPFAEFLVAAGAARSPDDVLITVTEDGSNPFGQPVTEVCDE